MTSAASMGTHELELNLAICNKRGQQNASGGICPLAWLPI